MKKAGIREARQNLSALIDEVKKGREIVITERGKPVARLAPLEKRSRRPFPDLTEFRKSMPRVEPPVSLAVFEEREESPY